MRGSNKQFHSCFWTHSGSRGRRRNGCAKMDGTKTATKEERIAARRARILGKSHKDLEGTIYRPCSGTDMEEKEASKSRRICKVIFMLYFHVLQVELSPFCVRMSAVVASEAQKVERKVDESKNLPA